MAEPLVYEGTHNVRIVMILPSKGQGVLGRVLQQGYVKA